jgi:signal transduction histidine kinase
MWACCAALLPQRAGDTTTAVVAMLAAITVSGLNGYLPSHTFCLASIAAYTGASAVWPGFCLFLPLVYYDAFGLKQAWWSLAAAAALAACFTGLPTNTSLIVASLMAVAYVLKHRAVTLERSHTELRRLRDSSHELTMMLKQKNRELIEKQDYEVRLAMLGERGRIAREIHDHVGHLLSRSILQVGAIMVAQRGADPQPAVGTSAGASPDSAVDTPADTAAQVELRQSLAMLRDTLSQAMNTIRASVHDLHEESLDLRTQIEALAQDFTFCPIRLDYRLESPPDKETAYCFIAIVKEGLSNIIRHSNATQVTLRLIEHPALYQLILEDNGSGTTGEPSGGLGLRSMADRVGALGGQLLIERQGGFRLFVSIPKGGRLHESSDHRR